VTPADGDLNPQAQHVRVPLLGRLCGPGNLLEEAQFLGDYPQRISVSGLIGHGGRDRKRLPRDHREGRRGLRGDRCERREGSLLLIGPHQ
jgi:hypothetical protein